MPVEPGIRAGQGMELERAERTQIRDLVMGREAAGREAGPAGISQRIRIC